MVRFLAGVVSDLGLRIFGGGGRHFILPLMFGRSQLLSVGELRKELVLCSTAERECALDYTARGLLHAYPLYRSPPASPLIVRWIPVTTSLSVSPAR
jgi:hypothetical protein